VGRLARGGRLPYTDIAGRRWIRRSNIESVAAVRVLLGRQWRLSLSQVARSASRKPSGWRILRFGHAEGGIQIANFASDQLNRRLTGFSQGGFPTFDARWRSGARPPCWCLTSQENGKAPSFPQVLAHCLLERAAGLLCPPTRPAAFQTS
jgi:hypothetical protein